MPQGTLVALDFRLLRPRAEQRGLERVLAVDVRSGNPQQEAYILSYPHAPNIPNLSQAQLWIELLPQLLEVTVQLLLVRQEQASV